MELYYLLAKQDTSRLKKGVDFFSFFSSVREKETLSGHFFHKFWNFPIRGEWGDPKDLKGIFWKSAHLSSRYLSEGDFLSSLFFKDKEFEYGLIGFCHLRVEEPIFFHQSRTKWISIGSFFSENHLSQNEEILFLLHQGRHWFSNIFHERNTAFFLGKETYNKFSSFRYPSFLVGLSVSDRNRLWMGLSGYKEKGKVECFENSRENSGEFSISFSSYQEENRDILFPSKLFLEKEGEWVYDSKKETKQILGNSVDTLLRKFYHPLRDDVKVFDLETLNLKSSRREEKSLSSVDLKRYLSFFPLSLFSSEYLLNLKEEFLFDKLFFLRRDLSIFFYFFGKIKKESLKMDFKKERFLSKKEVWFEESSYYSPRKDWISFHSLHLHQTYKRHEGEKWNYD